jgi:penicillin-binding protein 1C
VIESKEVLGIKLLLTNNGDFLLNSVPDKFKSVLFILKIFYKHPGFNPVAMVNAFQQNRKAGKVVRVEVL